MSKRPKDMTADELAAVPLAARGRRCALSGSGLEQPDDICTAMIGDELNGLHFDNDLGRWVRIPMSQRKLHRVPMASRR